MWYLIVSIPDLCTLTYFGIHRATIISKASELNVEENLKKPEKYSHMSRGMHGHSGLDSDTNLHLVKIYVPPLLLYGPELVLPSKTLINKLENYQKKILITNLIASNEHIRWATMRENLSSWFPTKRNSSQSPQLQRLARKLKFRL